MLASRVYLLFIFVLLSSCESKPNLLKNHNAATNAALGVVPDAKQIKSDFESVNFIANFRNFHVKQELHSVFYINGWIECTFVQEIDFSNNKVKTVGDSLMYIREVASITKSPTGQTVKSYGHQTILKGHQIKEFIDSKYDLIKLGFKKRQDAPPEDMIKYWQRIYPQ